MANQFLPYPYTITKTANGYEAYQGDNAAPQFRYVFATLGDLTYWIGLNEQAAP